MTIEIHRPELEALIQERMESGSFQDVDDLLIQALRDKPPVGVTEPKRRRTRAEAVAHILESRKGRRLPAGVTIQDLINKGRA